MTPSVAAPGDTDPSDAIAPAAKILAAPMSKTAFGEVVVVR